MVEERRKKEKKRVWLRGWMRKKDEKKKKKKEVEPRVWREKKREKKNYIIIFSQYFYNKF